MNSDEVYPYGWALRGQRCEAKRQGNRGARQRINLVAGLKQVRLLAPVIFTGYCDGRFFLEWLQQELIPALQPGDTVILDNAPFSFAALRVTLKMPSLLCCKPQDATSCSCQDTHLKIIKSNINGSLSKMLPGKSSQHSQTFTPLSQLSLSITLIKC
jgi:DDE superfamily endonuclease